MRKISTACLRELEVINLCGGEKLGYPADFEIDVDCGKILSIIVREEDCLSIFAKKEEYVIPWCNIECFGEDAILVKMSREELSCCFVEQRGKGKRKKCR